VLQLELYKSNQTVALRAGHRNSLRVSWGNPALTARACQRGSTSPRKRLGTCNFQVQKLCEHEVSTTSGEDICAMIVEFPCVRQSPHASPLQIRERFSPFIAAHGSHIAKVRKTGNISPAAPTARKASSRRALTAGFLRWLSALDGVRLQL
jgi:hypothetical protein